MKKKEFLKMCRETGASVEGHFLLTSGLHSAKYFQCAKLFEHPDKSEQICRSLLGNIIGTHVDVVVSPALGGIIVGYEIARQLGCRNIFTEREEGKMILRRGFEIKPNESVIVVEDVLTTGGSICEVIEVVESLGGNILGVYCIVDRSGGKAKFDYPRFSLITLEVVNYPPYECPLCKEGVPIIKPGSRR